MSRKVKGWGWAGIGALCVILLAWGATTVVTFLHQRSDENRITKIERIVVRPHRHHGRRHSSHGQPAPSKVVMPSKPHSGHSQPSPQHGGSPDSGGSTNAPAPLPTEHPEPRRPPSTSSPSLPETQTLPEPQTPSLPATPALPTPAPVPNAVEGATGAVKGIVCPVNAAGLEVCP